MKNEKLFSASIDRRLNIIDMENLQIFRSCKQITKGMISIPFETAFNSNRSRFLEKITSISAARDQRFCVLGTTKGILLYDCEKNKITRRYHTTPCASIQAYISTTGRFITFFDNQSVGVISTKGKKFISLYCIPKRGKLSYFGVIGEAMP